MNYILLIQKNKPCMKCDPLDVEPCEGTDVPDTPSCGIMVEDTDGEWIEMKSTRNIWPMLTQYKNVKNTINQRYYRAR